MIEALERLANLHGIARDYHDVWGNRHQVSDATLRALLKAMGIAAIDDAAAAAVLQSLESARDEQRVAPLVVLRENARPWTMHLRLPSPVAAMPLSVRVLTEDGRPCQDAAVAVVRRDAPTSAGATCVGVEVALTATLPPGYHQVEFVAGAQVVARTCCAVAPPACYLPTPPQGGRTWGVTAQLYGMRSARNWGIGDFTDLGMLVEQLGARGAGLVGVNPLHALFPALPEHASPYSPSSRLFRNILYIDVEAVPEWQDCEAARTLVRSAAFADRLAALRDSPLVDYAGVAAAKKQVLELLYRHFRQNYLAADNARAQAFRTFVLGGGAALRGHALFDALHESFHRDNRDVRGWTEWPEAFHDPRSPAVAQFAASHVEQVEYFAYLQWLAEDQFAAASANARAAGLAVGIYGDLAVSIDRGGAEAWANQDLYAIGASVGAPPDTFNMNGQDWGLPPMIPSRLRDAAYAPFLATLRANMRHAGALRIDHVMGLARLFWIPAGAHPAEGAYVQYPLTDLLGLLALESHRHRCMVIGEDLGTVPDALRATLAENAVLSYRVLIFERDSTAGFKPPDAYPPEALATVSTHDLPTLAGWWAGTDIALRADHGLLPSEQERESQVRERAADRLRLLTALDNAGLLPAGVSCDAIAATSVLDPVLATAVQTYLARTPSRLAVVQLEDLLGMQEQPNLPGTIDEYPNWRRKLSLPLEQWPEDEQVATLVAALVHARPRVQQASSQTLPPLHVPRATYRVQLNRHFTFSDARALVPYLAALGVSHVYCSPYLRARPGSLHGYDIVDHSSLNPELGTRAHFEQFVATLAEHGMGHLCDVVPNHVGVMGADNAWWMDVLEHGQASTCADYFDIDWAPFDAKLADRLLVPVLGDPYGTVLERGELKLAFERATGTFAITYFGHRFPLDPREYPTLLIPAFERIATTLPPAHAVPAARLVSLLQGLPPRTATDPASVARRRADSIAGKADLAALAALHRVLDDAITDVVEEFNGVPGQPATFERLHALLEAQAFHLAHWRVAADEINYRRFFDINDLAALRMENATVFDATHSFLLQLAANGKIDGLRIDHPDGLFDPAGYFEQLQARYRQLVLASGKSGNTVPPPIYIVLEKIAASHERLPVSWRVSGSTGYRFANLANGLFVAGGAKDSLDQCWREFAGPDALDYETTVRLAKQAIMQGPLAAELATLAHRALLIASSDHRTRDFTFNILRQSIQEVVACFPVYRTYIAGDGASVQDRHYIEWAVVRAQRASRSIDASVFDFLRALMLGTPPAAMAGDRMAQYREFAMRFQQFTSPVAAKGVEDTAFYTFNRLMALNDVGSDPEEFGTTVKAFHEASLARLNEWPDTLLATSTHDNKRSEDVRARIDVISERPDAWRRTAQRWRRMNRAHKRRVGDEDAPSANDEYLLYQTLVGTLPTGPLGDRELAAYRLRIQQYMLKAAREAKSRTSWLGPNTDYEAALDAFVAALLADGNHRFRNDLVRQCRDIAWFGMLNSLSLALVKFASPGVPDLYQGNELLDLRLVDPDNRAAVDYVLRRGYLARLEALVHGPARDVADAIPSWFAAPGDSPAKLWITYRLLRYRAAHRPLMATGEYLPLTVTGPRANHVVAFARRQGDTWSVAIAGRLFASLGLAFGALPVGKAVWEGTLVDLSMLPADIKLANILTREACVLENGRLPMAVAFRIFPAALLHCERGA